MFKNMFKFALYAVSIMQITSYAEEVSAVLLRQNMSTTIYFPEKTATISIDKPWVSDFATFSEDKKGIVFSGYYPGSTSVQFLDEKGFLIKSILIVVRENRDYQVTIFNPVQGTRETLDCALDCVPGVSDLDTGDNLGDILQKRDYKKRLVAIGN